jgi:hypothetical protein
MGPMVEPHAMSERTQNSCVGMPLLLAISLFEHYTYYCTHASLRMPVRTPLMLLHACQYVHTCMSKQAQLPCNAGSHTVANNCLHDNGFCFRTWNFPWKCPSMVLWEGCDLHLNSVADTAFVA